MPDVVRFALDSERDLYVPGAGKFTAGILDIPAGNAGLLSRVRFLVQPYKAVELGVTDETTPFPDLPAAGPGAALTDPYPQYLTEQDVPTSAALRAAFGRAAPVLSDFVYESGTGNLLSYVEDGITITLTYNADGTVATSKRGTDATQTYSYSGGNLVGVA
jgi:hypothetical protein